MCCAVGVSEYGGLGARGRGRQRRRVVVDVAQVGRRRLAQARAQPGRRVRRQPLLQVLQRRLERAHHAQLQPTQPSSPAPPRARRPPPAARRAPPRRAPDECGVDVPLRRPNAVFRVTTGSLCDATIRGWHASSEPWRAGAPGATGAGAGWWTCSREGT